MWSYGIDPDDTSAFERLYGPDGDWARFFARSPAYAGTELLRDPTGDRYLTIDRWADEASHAEFVERHRDEFERLDAAGARLTREETFVGRFEPIV
ncbi:MAG: hypothetical protein R3195_06370 [Gemmatimonadota bacterium]|nr:hypothetical protein [Gemmatimonadota bacterium]